VTERLQAAVLAHGGEASETAPGDVLEQDALHRLFGAERDDLVQVRSGRHER
jgi:hypothetical protein